MHRYFSDAKFQFRINYNQADNWERELNNDYKTANTIKVNTQYYGSVQNEGTRTGIKFRYLEMEVFHKFYATSMNRRVWDSLFIQ